MGDQVFLKVFPWKGVLQFGRKGKLNPRYIGPYIIMERVGMETYSLDLPPEMSKLHNVFYMSMLQKFVANPFHVLVQQTVELADDLSYVEEPVQILDRREQVLQNKVIPLVKVFWRSYTVEEATWESEESMWGQYPYLFLPQGMRILGPNSLRQGEL